MVKFNLNVRAPQNSKKDDITFAVVWPTLPQKGDTIDISPPGTGNTGWSVIVEKVQHWLGCQQIDVYCKIDKVGDPDLDEQEIFDSIESDKAITTLTGLGMY